MYHAEQSLHQSAHEFFKEIEANKTIQRYKDITNIQQIMDKMEPSAVAGRSDLKKVSCSPGRNTANANSASWYPPVSDLFRPTSYQIFHSDDLALFRYLPNEYRL